MSYDVLFWRQMMPLSISAKTIYEHLTAGERVAGLATLPIDVILARLGDVYAGFSPSTPIVPTREGSIEVSWSALHVRFDFRGICADCQRAVEVMREFDCPMYDPQEDRRYDAAGGTRLAEELPLFRDATDDERDAMARLSAGGIAGLVGQRRTGGCLQRATILLVIAVVLIGLIGVAIASMR